ncbi:hypothetical protein CH380_09095 [Leptospira adleri]|uniref:Uncharacterized protein n=1 Tax=Leptospira adleri TaxID=2023186 RepID=A0A2M9YQC9_9LEPT|nr:hypothetical protein CH380_09095 [Leptospira adleri]PJZ61247.1 hypothetical protein CH376_14145 [Leptospira adleri]
MSFLFAAISRGKSVHSDFLIFYLSSFSRIFFETLEGGKRRLLENSKVSFAKLAHFVLGKSI